METLTRGWLLIKIKVYSLQWCTLMKGNKAGDQYTGKQVHQKAQLKSVKGEADTGEYQDYQG